MYWKDLLQNKKVKISILCCGIFIAIIILISVINLIGHAGKQPIKISVLPKETQVFINGSTKNVNNSRIYLPEGEHNVTAFLDGYLYQKQTTTINKYSVEFSSQLTPLSTPLSEIDIYMDDHAYDAEDQTKDLARLQEDYPLISYLPYSTPDSLFYISYELNGNYPVININIKKANSNQALSDACFTIKNFNKNIPLGTYDIQINNYNNAFENSSTDNTETNPQKFLQIGFNSIKNIIVSTGNIDGEYYYTTIQLPITDSERSGAGYLTFKVILKQNGNTWELASTPNPILTVYNTPNTPIEIINKANSYNENNQ